MKISFAIVNGQTVKAQKTGDDDVHLVYNHAYKKGDCIILETEQPGFYDIRLEDTMLPAIVYLSGQKAVFPIPFGVDRYGYSPRSFKGKRHLITAHAVSADALGPCRDLALNSYDAINTEGMYPHATTNVTYPQTFRNRIMPDIGLFAARNVIDGIGANESHRLYPYQSWGINRNPDAWLHLDFGRNVDAEEISLLLRGEFPHDNYWVSVTVTCSDGTEEVISLKKTLSPQIFPLKRQAISWIRLTNLIPSEEPSPFPALTRLQVFGSENECSTDKGA